MEVPMRISIAACISGFVGAVLAGVVGSVPLAFAVPGGPSFDCNKASGAVEELICEDEGLRGLDLRMAEVFATALEHWPDDEVAVVKANQRGWIKGRNDCWKSDDIRACVESSYQTRIVELQIQSGQLEAASTVAYVCRDRQETTSQAVFYRESEPPSMVLTVGDDQVIAFVARSASGTRYVADNVEFWEHQGEARVDWFGTTLTCSKRQPQ
jgi:uncharacterized protein